MLISYLLTSSQVLVKHVRFCALVERRNFIRKHLQEHVDRGICRDSSQHPLHLPDRLEDTRTSMDCNHGLPPVGCSLSRVYPSLTYSRYEFRDCHEIKNKKHRRLPALTFAILLPLHNYNGCNGITIMSHNSK